MEPLGYAEHNFGTAALDDSGMVVSLSYINIYIYIHIICRRATCRPVQYLCLLIASQVNVTRVEYRYIYRWPDGICSISDPHRRQS